MYTMSLDKLESVTRLRTENREHLSIHRPSQMRRRRTMSSIEWTSHRRSNQIVHPLNAVWARLNMSVTHPAKMSSGIDKIAASSEHILG